MWQLVHISGYKAWWTLTRGSTMYFHTQYVRHDTHGKKAFLTYFWRMPWRDYDGALISRTPWSKMFSCVVLATFSAITKENMIRYYCNGTVSKHLKLFSINKHMSTVFPLLLRKIQAPTIPRKKKVWTSNGCTVMMDVCNQWISW